MSEHADTKDPLKQLTGPCRIYFGLICFSLAGSLFSKLSGMSPGPVAPIASALTIGLGFATVFEPMFKDRNLRQVGVIGFALVCSAAAELTGLMTGLPFGRYEYTENWAPTVIVAGKLFPVLLAPAWLLIVGASTQVFSKSKAPVLLGALLATAVDFVMEPVMAGPLGYWHWKERGPLPGGAALLNPVGWFLTAAIVGYVVTLSGVENRRSAGIVLCTHVGFTFCIGLIALIPR